MHYFEQNGYDNMLKLLTVLGNAYGLSQEETQKIIKQYTLYDSEKKPTSFRPMISIVCALDKARDKSNTLSEYAIDCEFSLLYPSFRANLEGQYGKSRTLFGFVKTGDDVYKSSREHAHDIVKSLQNAQESAQQSYERFIVARNIVKYVLISGAMIGAFLAYRAVNGHNKHESLLPRDEPVKRLTPDMEWNY